MSGDQLSSPAMSALLTLVEEATRATPEGVKYFVEPAEDALRRATSRRHHIVFGRRGSGKSSLLRKAAADLTTDRRPIAWVDLEPFKNHSYPDLLLSILIATFKEFKKWLETAAVTPGTKRSFWRLFGRTPSRPAFDRDSCEALVRRLTDQLGQLEGQLHAAESADVSIQHARQRAATETDGVGTNYAIGTENTGARVEATYSLQTREAVRDVERQEFRRHKVEFLRRHVMDYQEIFDEGHGLFPDRTSPSRWLA